MTNLNAAPTTASLTASERAEARRIVEASPLELEITFDGKIRVEPLTRYGVKMVSGRIVKDGTTPAFTGRILYDSWNRPDDPWLWDIIDRRQLPDDTGVPTYGGTYSAHQFATQLAALADLVHAVQSL